MVDEDLNVLLIEINGTPGLQRKGFGDAVYQAFSNFIIGGISEFAFGADPKPGHDFTYVAPLDDEMTKRLAVDGEGLLRRGTREYTEAVVASHKSKLADAAAAAENTIVVLLDDPALEAAYRARLAPAGWALLSMIEAVSAKAVTAVLVAGEYALDKNLRRFKCKVSNEITATVQSEMAEASRGAASAPEDGVALYMVHGRAAKLQLDNGLHNTAGGASAGPIDLGS